MLIGYDQRVSESAETTPQESRTRWEKFVWPRWLPIPSRLPLIAQLAGAFALVAAFAMPQFSFVTSAPAGARPASPAAPAPPPAPPAEPPRPAHLNLEVRHSFASVDLSVTVDREPALDTKLAGSRKRFGVLGKRAEIGYTKTLDLSPGRHIVRVRVRSVADKFDQTRVEQFDLEPAAVASMRIAADKSGLSVVANRPPAAPKMASIAKVPDVATASAEPPAPAPQIAHVADASALAELYQTLRSTLIAMAGFVASAATGFLVESYLRSRRAFAFAQQAAQEAEFADRRRRRRANRARESEDVQTGTAG